MIKIFRPAVMWLMLIVVALGMSQKSYADRYYNLKIKGVEIKNTGTGPYLTFAVAGSINTGCNISDTWMFFTIYVPGTSATEPTGLMKMYLAQLLAAKASGEIIWVDYNCDPNGFAVFNTINSSD